MMPGGKVHDNEAPLGGNAHDNETPLGGNVHSGDERQRCKSKLSTSHGANVICLLSNV